MPNWVYNTLHCTKEVAEKVLIKKEDGSYDFTYESFIPSPRVKEQCDKMYYATAESCIQQEEDRPWFDWYKWNHDNWGVKWDACDVEVFTEDDDDWQIAFCSPWMPPLPIMRKLAEMFPYEIQGYCCEEADNFRPFEWEAEENGMLHIQEQDVFWDEPEEDGTERECDVESLFTHSLKSSEFDF